MMDDENRIFSVKQVRLCVGLFLLLIVVVVIFSIHRSITFRITKTDPAVSAVATTSPFFKVSFNKPLAKTVSANVSPQNFPTSYTVTGAAITVTFGNQLQEGATYSVHLTHITDTAGAHLPDKTFTFVAQSLSSADLSPEQQQALNVKQERYNAVKDDGLVKLLPFNGGGNEFQISYTIHYSGQTPRLIIIVTTATPQGQADALNWIKQVGFDPSKYTITFLSQANDE